MAAKASVSRRLILWLAGATILALAVFLVLRRRTSSSSSSNVDSLDTSGRPGPDLATVSAAQQPSGGGSSVPGRLPPGVVNQPPGVEQIVQRNDTTSPDSPSMQTPTGDTYQPFTATETPATETPATFIDETDMRYGGYAFYGT